MSRPSTRNALALVLAAVACHGQPPLEAFSPAALDRAARRYLEDAAFRRQSLVDSLETPKNSYSRERLGAYGLETHGWDVLPIWNPRSQPVRAGELASAPLSSEVAPLWDGERPRTQAAWLALGREVFFGYPLRAEPALATALGDPERASAFGLTRTADGVYPGILRFQDVDGQLRIGISCALCHSAVRGGALVVGAARRRFDFGGLLAWHARVTGAALAPELAARLLRWGPGRADITQDREEDPVAIPDLWGLVHQSALTQGATLRHIGPVALAIRQETQLIEANHQRTRPPRELAWALALYVYSLAPPSRAAGQDPSEVARGAEIFSARCTGCHDNEVGGGEPVPASRVGTDSALATGAARGTGLYRPPALLELAHAAPYLHHGALATLDDLFTPARLAPDWHGGVRGPGPVSGHEYGFDLAPQDRAALEDYLLSR